MNLTVDNFFRYFMFHVTSRELTPKAMCQARVTSIMLGIFTAGIIHLICRIAFYKRFSSVTLPLTSTKALRVDALAKGALLKDPVDLQMRASAPSPVIPNSPSQSISQNPSPKASAVVQPSPVKTSVERTVPPLKFAILYKLEKDIHAKGHYEFNVKSTLVEKKPSDAVLMQGKTALVDARKLLFPVDSDIMVKVESLKKNQESELLRTKVKLEEIDKFLKSPSKATLAQSVINLIVPEAAKLEADADAKKKETGATWTLYLKYPDNPLPPSLGDQLQSFRKGYKKTIHSLNQAIPKTDTFLKTRSILDYIPIMFGSKLKDVPDFKTVRGENVTAFLPVNPNSKFATFHPTVDVVGQEALAEIAFDDEGTQLCSAILTFDKPMGSVPIQARKSNRKLDWKVPTMTDEQLQGIGDENPKVVEEVISKGLNIFIFKLKELKATAPAQTNSKAVHSGDFEYIPNTAMFMRVSSLACSEISLQNTLTPTTLSKKVLKLGAEITEAGDAVLDSFS